MNSLQAMKTFRWLKAALAPLVVATLVAGCSSGGAPTVENPVTRPPDVVTYTGPASANADVQAFRINLWENIKANNRCGGCHHAGGQTPMFARNDDVNLAYQEANSVVNLQQPDQSRMVTKVAGGHNCWLQSPSACGDTLTVWIRNWAGANATGGTQIQLVPPVIKEVGGGKGFPATANTPVAPGSPITFANSSLYALVRNTGTANCVRCHSSNSATMQQPFFADADVDTAFAAIKAKINLDSPDQSRLVVRLRDEFHNCWGSAGCAANAQTMLDAINEFAGPIQVTQVDPNLLISKALTLYDGTVASGGNRYETATIAKYEFKTGMGAIAYDTSGLEPALNLTLSGDVTWVGGWGVNIKTGGKAQGTAAASKKLSDMIKATGEFSIEAWVNNANVDQEDAYIVSYSAGVNSRNFTLAQQMYQYQGLTRSSTTDANGMPPLLTRAADQDAQAALQHVVMTYSPVEGRRLYVNGEFTGDMDSVSGGGLSDWDDTFALVLGNETSSNRQWQGLLRMVAIHNRALTPTQIQQNFDAGVGEKYFMLFDVGHLVPSVPQAYVMLEAAQLDSYGLQFSKPTFISLDPNANVDNVVIEGVRIGRNGIVSEHGQAYEPLKSTVGGANYVAGTGQELTKIGTVIALERGPFEDTFFLQFDKIANLSNPLPDPPAPVAPPPVDLPAESDVGLKTFDELNATLSQLTGIPQTNPRIAATYDLVKQALPAVEKLGTFGPAQQTALAQLAIQYCNQMVDNAAARTAFFGSSLNPSATGTATFGSQASPNNANRDIVISALLTKGINTGLEWNPESMIAPELDNLINKLVSGPTGSAANGTGTVMKATCGAVLGSGTTLIQ
ncbi:MAG TPA: LamG domain-containing protein [Steroidobacteraceae bacterium]|nr:LamG domain-containing protein [Steroidobacteraceae bacterium]